MNSQTVNPYRLAVWCFVVAMALVCFTEVTHAQTLTVSSSGDAGPTSGTNWSISGTALTVTGTANIQAAVIEAALASGDLAIEGNTTGFAVAINEAIEVTSAGHHLRIGTTTNTGAITVSQAITVNGPITLYGSNITLNGNVTTQGDFYVRSTTYIDQGNSRSTTTNGGDVIYWAGGSGGSGEAYIRPGTLVTNGGHVFMGGDFDAVDTRSWHGHTVGGGYAFSSNNAGVALRGDIDTRVTNNQSLGGDVYIAGESGQASLGDVAAETTNRTISAGNGNIALLPFSEMLQTNGSLQMILETTGKISIAPVSGRSFWTGRVPVFTYNGSLSSGTFNGSSALAGVQIPNFANIGGWELGTYSGTGEAGDSPYVDANIKNMRLDVGFTVAGPIRVKGDALAIIQNLEATAAGAEILLKSDGPGTGNDEGWISLQADLTTNGGDIILWSNAANRTSGTANNEIWFSDNRTLTSNGGKIVLAGGLDDGSNGGTANDGIPDGFAFRGGNTEAAIRLARNAKLLSGNGDIIIRGEGGTGNTSDGIRAIDQLLINSGTGTININGKSAGAVAINIGNDGSNNAQNIAITSESTSNSAISITGTTTTNNWAINFANSSGGGNILVQSTATTGGGVNITGISNGSLGFHNRLNSGRTQILSVSGGITISTSSSSSSEGGFAHRSQNGFYIGERFDATAVNGVTPVTGFTGNILLSATGGLNSEDNLYFRTDGGDITLQVNRFDDAFPLTQLVTSGAVVIEPTGDDFTADLTFNSGWSFGADISSLRIGKSATSADGTGDRNITLSPAISIAGPISVYAKDISLGSSLQSTADGAAISLLASGNITNSAATTITTDGGNVLLASDTDGNNAGYIRLLQGLTINTSGGNITLGGGDLTGSGFAHGTNVSALAEGVRIDKTLALNSGNGNIVIRGKTSTFSESNMALGNAGFGVYDLTSAGSINSGTGTISITGVNQNPSVTDYSSGIVFALNNNHVVTIQSANTTNNAITLSGHAIGPNEGNYGMEVDYNSPLTLLATGDGGGITVNTSQRTTTNRYELVTRSAFNVLANGGAIELLGGQATGANAGGIWYKSAAAFLGSKASSAVTSSSSDITIAYDQFDWPVSEDPFLATSGLVVIRPYSTSFSQAVNSGWFRFNQNNQAMTGLTIGKEGNTADITHGIRATEAAGPIRFYGGNQAIRENLTSTAAGAEVLLKGSGNIRVSTDKSIITNGGDITLWSDTDDDGGHVYLRNAVVLDSRTNADRSATNTSTASGGGTITLGGGSASTTLASGGLVPTGMAWQSDGSIPAGVLLGSYTQGITKNNTGIQLLSGGGDISLRGKSTVGADQVRLGVAMMEGTTLDAGTTGSIDIVGEAEGPATNGVAGVDMPAWRSATGHPSPIIRTHDGDITISGSSANSVDSGSAVLLGANSASPLIISSTGSGAITIEGTGMGPRSSVAMSATQLLASSGLIRVKSEEGVVSTSHTVPIYLGSLAGSPVTASTSNVEIVANGLSLSSGNGFQANTTGTFTLEPAGDDFSSDITFPIANLSLDAAVSGLTIGKESSADGSSDKNVTINGATSIAGDIILYGGDIDIEAALTATDSDISLTASGEVSQDATVAAAITADRLSLNGTGTFTLQHPDNQVDIMAGGASGARLGAVSYFNSGALTIGSVNPTGIYSSGDVLIETGTGNINLSEPVDTTSTTNDTTGYSGAIVLNAGKDGSTGSEAGGDIIVSNNGSVSSNGINKLFSGSKENSTGLATLAVGGERFLVDETTTTFEPELTGGTTYALYRLGKFGDGNLTIVASGGAPEGSGWRYSNGVLSTSQDDVDVNASDVVAKLGLGGLTIEAKNITVNSAVSWANANLLRLEASNTITVASSHDVTNTGGADIELIANASITIGASQISTTGGNIRIEAISGEFDVARAIQMAGAEISTSGAGTIVMTGDATNSTRTNASSWGVNFTGSNVIQSEHGAISISGVGGSGSLNSRGLVADRHGFKVLSASGAITLSDRKPAGCVSCDYRGAYFEPASDGSIVLGSDGSTVLTAGSSASASDILLLADRFTATGGISNLSTTGSVTLAPVNAAFAADQTFPGDLAFAAGVASVVIGKPGNTAAVTIDQPLAIAAPITVYSDKLLIDSALTATDSQITVIGAAADDGVGLVEILADGVLTADAVLVRNIDQAHLGLKDGTAVGSVSVNHMASDGGDRLSIINYQALTIGSVDVVDGISASGAVIIETETGDIIVTEAITSTLSAGSAITLNAGKDQAIGDDAGGDILITGDGSISIEPDAVAALFSGSPANSTGLSVEADEALVFYDETSTLPSLDAGKKYAIYRSTTPYKLFIDSEPATTAASGVALTPQPVIQIVDDFDNVIRTDDASVIQVEIFSGEQGTLIGTQERMVTAGVATFTDLALRGPVGQTYRLRFSSLGLYAAASDDIVITDPGPVDLLASSMTATPVGNLIADGSDTAVLVIVVTDAFGNPIPSQAVVLTLNDADGRLLQATSGSTNAIGQVATTLASTVAGATTVNAYLSSEDPANLIASIDVGFLAGAPAKLQSISGNGQTAEVAQTVTQPLRVRVRDAQDNVVAGASVVFSGDGTTLPVSGVAISDSTGLAELDWVLGETAGNQSITATLAGSDPAVTVTFLATAEPGPPAQFSLELGDARQLTTIPFDVDVVLQDAYGNTTVADTDLTVALTANNTSKVANIVGAQDGTLEIDQQPGAISATLSAGQDTINWVDVVYAGLSAPDVETPDIELIATATLNSQTLTGKTLISARDIKLSLTAAPTEITADGIESSLLTAQLLDLQDVAVPNQPFRFENTAGVLIDATTLEPLSDPVVIQGDANGQAQVRLRSGTAMATAKVTVGSRGADPVSVNIELKADAADVASSLVSAQPTSIVANGAAESTITIQLVDANGNLTDRLPTGQALTLASSSGTLLGNLEDQGTGRYTQVLRAPLALGASTLEAFIGATAITDQATVNFVADVPSQIQVIGGNAQTGTVDQTLANALTVKVTDAQGNVIDNAEVIFTGPGSTTPADGRVFTDVQGLASINWKLGTVRGVQTLTATLGTDPLIQAPLQATAVADVASSMQVIQQPLAQANNTVMATQPSIELLDQFGNRVVQDNQTAVTVGLVAGVSLSLSGNTVVTATNGVVTFTDLLLTGPLNVTDQLSFSGPGLTTAVSDAVALTQAGALDLSASSMTATPAAMVVADGQSASTVLLQAVDISGNAVVGETIHMVASGGQLAVSQGQTNAQGQFSTTLTSSEAREVTVSAYHQSISPANLIDQATVGFTADAPGQLLMVAGNQQQATVGTAVSTPLTVRVLDAYNNAVAGATVVFAGDGAITPTDGLVISDATGQASAQWTLPEKAGTAVIEAQLAGSNPVLSQRFTATATADQGVELVVAVTDPVQLRTIPFELSVTLVDQFGNAVAADEALTIELSATNSSVDAQRPGAKAGTLYRHATSGTALSLTLAAGQSTVMTTEAAYDGLSAASVEVPDIGLQAVVVGHSLAGQAMIGVRDVLLQGVATPDQIQADGQSAARIVFTLSDLDGNALANQAIAIDNTAGTLWSTSAQAVSAPVELLTDQSGQASIDLRAGEVVTDAVITARRYGLSPVSVSVALVEPRDNDAVNILIGFDPDSSDANALTRPTLDDYINAGITEARQEHVAAYNSALGNLDLTIEEIEKLVTSYNKLLDEAGSGSSTLTVEDFTNLGIVVTESAQLALLNSIIANTSAEALKNHDALLTIAVAVDTIIAWVQGEPNSVPITLDTLAWLGVTGISPEKLGVVLDALFNHPDGLAAIGSIAALQALINGVLLDDALANLLGFGADSSAPPVYADYLNAGISEAIESQVQAYNSALANLGLNIEQVAEMVDGYNALLAQASDGVVTLSLADYAALGLSTVSSQQLPLLNSVLASKPTALLSDHSTLLSIEQALMALTRWMLGLPVSPALTIADLQLLGITGIDSQDFEAVMAALAEHPQADAMDSLAMLQAIISEILFGLRALPVPVNSGLMVLMLMVLLWLVAIRSQAFMANSQSQRQQSQ